MGQQRRYRSGSVRRKRTFIARRAQIRSPKEAVNDEQRSPRRATFS